jgi:hypothetical protein
VLVGVSAGDWVWAEAQVRTTQEATIASKIAIDVLGGISTPQYFLGLDLVLLVRWQFKTVVGEPTDA